MITDPAQQTIEKNVLQAVKMLINDGHLPDPLPELGEYTWLCQQIATVMLKAPHQLAREGMLKAIRHHPYNKSFDDLLKRGFDPPPQSQRLRLMNHQPLKSLQAR